MSKDFDVHGEKSKSAETCDPISETEKDVQQTQESVSLMNSMKVKYCDEEHKSKVICFCQDDDVYLCDECLNEDHIGHRILNIQTQIQKQISQAQEFQFQSNKLIKDCVILMEKINIDEIFCSLSQKIHSEFDKFIEQLMKYKESKIKSILESDFIQQFVKKTRRIEGRIQELEILESRFKNVENILKDSSEREGEIGVNLKESEKVLADFGAQLESQKRDINSHILKSSRNLYNFQFQIILDSNVIDKMVDASVKILQEQLLEEENKELFKSGSQIEKKSNSEELKKEEDKKESYIEEMKWELPHSKSVNMVDENNEVDELRKSKRLKSEEINLGEYARRIENCTKAPEDNENVEEEKHYREIENGEINTGGLQEEQKKSNNKTCDLSIPSLHYFEFNTKRLCIYQPLSGNFFHIPLKITLSIPGEFDSIIVNRIIYLAGGTYDNEKILNKFYQVDLFSQSLLPLNSMIHKRKNHVLTSYKTKLIYAVGGCNRHGTLSSCEIYNIPKNKWSILSSLNFPRAQASLCYITNFLYCFGGWNNKLVYKIERYNVLLESQWEVCNVKSVKGLSLNPNKKRIRKICGRVTAGIAPISHSEILIFGGYSNPSNLKTCYKFDIQTRKIEELSNMIREDCFYQQKSLLIDNKIYAIGFDEVNLHIYDLATQKWKAFLQQSK